MVTSVWHVQLFGGLRAERTGVGAVTRFRTQKTASLFALLCCSPGRMFGREELIDLFWPEADLDLGRNSLRVTLASLRRVLEPPPLPSGSVLLSTRHHVQLRSEAVATDVAAFESALKAGERERAKAIYTTGPLLPGMYDDWAILETERLAALADGLLDTAPAGMRTEAADRESADEPVRPPAPSPLRVALPTYLTPFFGRDEEAARLAMLLADPGARLVTLTGPGGIGKTRLAVETAHQFLRGKGRASARHLSGGIHFVPLVACVDGQQMALAIAQAVAPPCRSSEGAEGVCSPPEGLHPWAELKRHLSDRRTVLILDNLEQVEPIALAATLGDLLQRLPGVTCLCTSRRRVGVRGERVVRLGTLPTPSVDDPLATVAANPAVALFADRAREADADFGLTSGNYEKVAAICVHLAGLPLAIELAAAWANVFSPRQLLERLIEGATRFDARSRGMGRGEHEERHQSLQAVVDWSCDLLPQEARQLFARLSVFRGSFTLDAATIVADLPATRDHLARLLEHSLVSVAPQAMTDEDERRFLQITVLRELAADRLMGEEDEAGEEQQATARRHAQFFTTLLAQTEGQPEADALLPDLANIEAALHFWEAAGDLSAALGIGAKIYRLWWMRGNWRSGAEALAQLATRGGGCDPLLVAQVWNAAWQLAYHCGDVALTEALIARQEEATMSDPELNALANTGHGVLALGQGDWEVARVYLEKALLYYRTVPLSPHLPRILLNLAHIERAQNHRERADALTDEALALYRDVLHDEEGVALCVSRRGDSDWQRGDRAAARRAYEEGLRLFRAIPMPPRVAQLQSWLAELDLEEGETAAATARLVECLPIVRAFENPGLQCSTFEAMARFCCATEQFPLAAHFFGAAQRRRVAAAVRLPLLRDRWNALETTLRTALGGSRFDACRREGSLWSTRDVLDQAERLLRDAEKIAIRP